MMVKSIGLGAIAGTVLFLMSPGFEENRALHAQTTPVGAADQVPEYVWDPTWPKLPLRDNWVTGNVVGVSTDANDHIWVVHRERAAPSAAQRDCCAAAPAVLEFDQAGDLMQAWGGPSAEQLAAATKGPVPKMTWTAPTNYQWVNSEHNIFVDHKDNVWLGNYSGSHVLKFTRQGKFLLQIGRVGAKGQSSNDTDALASPTGIAVDPKGNEVYIADGYGNRRVIVFDADTGAYKRHWGAYGKKPDDAAPIELKARVPAVQFNTVHCVILDKDGFVWVCDRAHSRIQVFRKDGTFVREGWFGAPEAGTVQAVVALDDGKGGVNRAPLGSVFDLTFSRDADQRFGFIADGRNERVWVFRRNDMKIIGSIGHAGRWGGGFSMAHNLAVDSKNNLYVSESAGSRVQRFLYKGLRRAS